jgi:cysteine desulfuration protein SufE
MAASIDAELEELVDEFSLFSGWEEQMSYLIDEGKKLKGLPLERCNDANRVPGCASRAWLVVSRLDDGRLLVEGDTESILSRGTLYVILRLFSCRCPAEILRFDIRSALTKLDLNRLTPSRSNGLASMVDRVYREARLAMAA